MKDILEQDIQYLKGVGPTRKLILNKLGIETINDLITYYPRDYEDRTIFKKVNELNDGERVCIKLHILSSVAEKKINRGKSIYKVVAQDETGTIICTWFNNRFVKQYLLKGQEYLFYGKVSVNNGKIELIQPEYEKIDEKNKTGRIVPIYPLTESINQTILRKEILMALKIAGNNLKDMLPEYILKENSLSNFEYSIKNIHFPNSKQAFEKARYRLAFEELLLLQLMLLSLKNGYIKQDGIVFDKINTDEIINILPFKLTNAQKKVLEEIYSDMESNKSMNRLLQGDVGSGKTIVAAITMYKAIKSGYQCVLMAPTSILATQHYETIKELYDKLNIKTEILIGTTKKKNKDIINQKLKNGEIDVLIGTHAVIEDNVEFMNLGLVITDEQHRFGVRQRNKLSSKGNNVDVLIMTATPIPRTLALILYGDLDISIIDELPPGRQKVDTFSITKDKGERLNSFIIENAKKGSQIYIVCPLVEDSENITAKSVEEMKEYYTQKLIGCRVECLHGKMKNKDKVNIMEKFKNKEIDVLVSTTVIEVGVNIPNANIMVVENSERFGLAQLHQLRGRVGRGKTKSYCFLKYEAISQIIKKRLAVMEKTNDGFIIAEKDLELRGPGEFFGTKQHGLPEFKVANLFTDRDILKTTNSIANKIIDEDPKLELEKNIKLNESLKEKNKKNLEL